MKKSRKSKIVLFSVLGLATISLATVGFASWVISGVTPATSDNITAEVGKIEDKTLSATITSTTEDLSVRFDNVAKGTTNAKFDNGDGKVEKLDFTIKTKITTTGTKLEGLLASINYEFAPTEFLTTAITNNYITFDSSKKNCTITISDSSSSVNVTAPSGITSTGTYTSAQEITISSKFSFKWGTAFKGNNPGYLEATSENAEKIKAFVNTFGSTAESKALLTVTVTPVAVTKA